MKIEIEEIKKMCDPSRDQKIYVEDVVMEAGALRKLPRILSEKYPQHRHIVMLCDTHTYEAAGREAERLAPGIHPIVLEAENLHADERGVAQAGAALDTYPNADFLIACGSGTIHDLTRYHAYQRKIDFLSLPTAASVDGFVSTMAAMTWHGMKKTFTAVSPVFVLADSAVFSRAPKRLSASGAGDLLGKYTALCDWRIAAAVTGEYISRPVVAWEYKMLRELTGHLDGIGSGDIDACEHLMYGLLLSGLAMQILTYSRPASGCEHHCSHLWEEAAINAPTASLHGEKVGVGLCLAAAVYKQALARIQAGGYRVREHVEVETELIKEKFRNPALQAEILKENTPNVMGSISGRQLKEQEAAIIEILEELPGPEQAEAWLRRAGGVTTLSGLGLDEGIRTLTLRLSPYVRQRLTFMRLLKFYSFYEDIIA